MKLSLWLLRGLAIAAIASGACSDSALAQKPAKPPVVTVASKPFTENVILGEMIAHLVRAAGAEVKYQKGGTPVVFKALQAGEVDVYPEYTGTLASDILAGESARSDEEIRAALARRGIHMSERLGFYNTYALGLKEDAANRLGLSRISQLAEPAQSKLRFGFSEEFTNRSDGWPGLSRHYGLQQRPRVLDHDLAYRGLEQGALDVTDLFLTDAEIRSYNLRVLDDDRGYFPQYHCVLLFRADLQQRLPQVVASIRRLEGKFDNAQMHEMNVRSKIDHVPEAQVAATFLAGALGLNVEVHQTTVWQNLWITTRQHLFLVVVSLSAAVLAGIPLGIWSYKWPPLGHAILSAIGIIQTLPSMAVLVFMIPLFGLGPWPAIAALFLYSLLPIVRGTYAGLKEIPANLKESAVVLGLSPRAKLWLVELPIASRSILSGIKTSAVINVGTATIGALIGAGGYGEPILTGIRRDELGLILQGAIPAAVLALVVQGVFDLLERILVPHSLRLSTKSA